MTLDKKKFRPVLLLGVTILPLFGWIYTGFVSGSGGCDVPSRELRPCCKDESKVGTSCFQIQAAAGDCMGEGAPAVYEVEEYPTERVDADAGHTEEIGVDCLKMIRCVPDITSGECKDSGIWTGYTMGIKVIQKDAIPCQ
ncbi:MAG: hypothetical protein IJH68_12720 [Thermoguttaceae bacterium]|nr:hypothetical protein [Thermoguttaceae bacterium]